VQCGVCIRSCPYELVKADHRHFLISVGGRRGRHPKIGRELLTADSEEEVLFAIEKIIDWVYRRAWSGRLLSEQLDDLHFGKFKEDIAVAMKGKKAVAPVENA
jgi:dissimilatory sulfite reductase (desulfoviridin) alpha/beta subunit